MDWSEMSDEDAVDANWCLDHNAGIQLSRSVGWGFCWVHLMSQSSCWKSSELNFYESSCLDSISSFLERGDLENFAGKRRWLIIILFWQCHREIQCPRRGKCASISSKIERTQRRWPLYDVWDEGCFWRPWKFGRWQWVAFVGNMCATNIPQKCDLHVGFRFMI